jgi:hypothetical protein
MNHGGWVSTFAPICFSMSRLEQHHRRQPSDGPIGHADPTGRSHVQETNMDHTTHRAGTVAGCRDCQRMAYEPGWYASLVAFGADAVVLEETSALRLV